MSRRLMSLICLGMYCLCLWLAVQTVEKVRQISPGVSLRYAQALTGEQVKKAQTYIKSSQNTDGLMVTFWEETQVAVRSPVSTRTCTDVCSIGFCGTAHDAYGASYVVGTAPGSGDTSQCAVSTALAWQLFGSTDILEQALTLDPDTEDARTYRVCGVFVSETEQILYGVETTAAFQLLELTHVSRDNPGQSVQQLLAAAGLAQPDQILYDAALAWVLSALIGIPELLLLLCAGCRLLRLFRNKSLREVIGFGIALLLVCLLPTCLASLPGWMIPNQWGSMAAWHSLLSAAGDRLTEWFALCPTARDVQLKGETGLCPYPIQEIFEKVGTVLYYRRGCAKHRSGASRPRLLYHEAKMLACKGIFAKPSTARLCEAQERRKPTATIIP